MKKKQKVSFFDTPTSKQKGAYVGIDLSVLYKTRHEVMYRLTELYLPKTDNQRSKMLEYNYERMRHQNDNENQQTRELKRKVKEELKIAHAKLRH